MAVDALSDVLKTVRLTSAVFFDVKAKAPWVAEQPPGETILPLIRPDAEHLISYHVLSEGRCFVNIIGEEPMLLEAGQVVVFTRGDAHVLSSTPGMRAKPGGEARYDPDWRGRAPFLLDFGEGDAVSARLICGFLACDASPFNPLLDNLPPVIIAGDKGDGGWLGQFIHLATAESAGGRAGGEGVLAKLSELMFIEVVRRYLETLPAEQTGWLAGLRDPFVGKALSLLHAIPANNWSIDELAKEVGLSRSVLAERFTDLVGLPPTQYHAHWRMQIAAAMLSNGTTNIATIAAETGYGSEAAFSRAFKKIVGMPPSAWRQRPSA